MFNYWQASGGEEKWSAINASALAAHIEKTKPAFTTVLSVSKLVEDLDQEEKAKLSYLGPLYLDWDGADIALVLPKVNSLLDKLVDLKVDLTMIRFYATGGKGFHAEIPAQLFMEKVPKGGTQNLPIIYREVALDLYVDTLDMRVYSQGRGRMWRTPNVVRSNGRYKVPVTAEEIRGMTAESYIELTSAPREPMPLTAPEMCVDLAIVYARAAQKVETKLKGTNKRKRDPLAKTKAKALSVEMMMAGIGLKPGVGFHELALQITIASTTAGYTEDKMIELCADLIANHQSDGQRYNTPLKRKEELLRLYRYVDDNPCYDFSIGAIKTLLEHDAPDLDGVIVSKEDIVTGINEAKVEAGVKGKDLKPDEYDDDNTAGVTLTRYGVYAATEHGKKRICAVSFEDVHLLKSTETGQMSGYEAMVLVNGERTGRQMMELDTFASLQMFNRFCARMGHALQGSENHIRGLMMRFVELGNKKGRTMYITKREGLDVVNVPYHENATLREPFMVWADNRGVLLDPRIPAEAIEMSFQGFPDPHGVFKTDITDAPKLTEWFDVSNHKAALADTLNNLFTCQQPEVIGKLIGWYTASIYRMLFHKAYNQFPVLHINGAAGAGKTAMNTSLMSLFFYNNEPKMLTPGSTLFAIKQHMAGSASIPLLLDEYKPHDMGTELHSAFKLMIRDAYNCRSVSKGGGSRENDDYRKLNETQLSAPLVVIAEAAEEEAAVSERIVLVTFVKPPSSMSTQWAARYQNWSANKKHLTVLGQWLVGQAINTSSVAALRQEFDPIYQAARRKYMLTVDDLQADLPKDELRKKQNAKERSVYNFSVALYGLQKFRGLVRQLYADRFESNFDEMEKGIYSRMSDLESSTQAEWAKVMSNMSTMTYHIEPDSPLALRNNFEYAFTTVGDRDAIEIPVRNMYLKYRSWCRQNSIKPLFAGDQSFMHSIKDCPALLEYGVGRKLKVPGVYTFDVLKLQELGVDIFKGGT